MARETVFAQSMNAYSTKKFLNGEISENDFEGGSVLDSISGQSMDLQPLKFDSGEKWCQLFSAKFWGVHEKSKDRMEMLYRQAQIKLSEFDQVNIFKRLRKFEIMARACGMDTPKRQYLIERN